MGLMRSLLLAGSESRWLRAQATRRAFVRRAVSRFMPGESLEDALGTAAALKQDGIGLVLTRLGESVSDAAEADAVATHYLEALERIRATSVAAEISVKPTQLGLDIEPERCLAHLRALAGQAAALGNFVWIDMEQSRYVDATLDLTRRVRAEHANVGVCLQAYLFRTVQDVERLLPTGAGIRLVKGAYREPPEIAFPRKRDVDANYLALARRLLADDARKAGVRAVFGTHDSRLLRAIVDHAAAIGLPARAAEFHLLYGIQRAQQQRLARAGHTVRVLVSYGSYWFPWYMRRLAERPANVLFVAKSLVRA
ncbi:MAG TPA: proline dehydrogenase family protein, partial [Vicinamibacteria bacterium]|nr:proline dehydrogenase family protein [Vicinamibacteria bacterium]